jgi:hypothetical protein
MDQSPLPRGSFQVRNSFGEEHRVVPELPQAAVAVEAQYPANPPGAMIVINVLGVGSATDGTDAPLLSQHLVDLCLPHAVAPAQVVLARAATLLDAGLSARVVAGLAVAAEATATSLASRKLVERLD